MKKTLLYLNFILTVIAIVLTTIVLQNLSIIPKAHATSNGFYQLPLNENGELPVRMMNSRMDVSLVDINTTDELEVDIQEISGRTVYNGKLPVEK